ncbi:MAG: glycosyltransferase [Kiloniellales bacterium]|nr:glycosyltransferase [Kiloniellales bacterium]
MADILLIASLLPPLAWLYLLHFHGGFWRGRERLDGAPGKLADWPAVVAIVPARNEAEVIGQAMASLLRQDYPGALSVILVDDHSEDGTAEAASAAARATTNPERLQVRQARDLPAGWLGKPWALSEGLRQADALTPEAPYVWLTDADIAHDPLNLRRLVAKAEAEDLDQVSQMVLLRSEGFWARLLIPAFVFFFQKLYPFAWINDHRRKVAGAAGGCVLLRRQALAAAGGFAEIKDALIDDCTLARAVADRGRPGGGRLFLALTDTAESLRPYEGLGGVWRMVARSAYTQLRHSPLLLLGTLLGMALLYALAPTIVLSFPWHAALLPAALSLFAWALMAGAFLPTLRLYRQPPAFALLLPLAGLLYAAMTLDSALAHWRGRGGAWKGRVAGGAALERGGNAG